MSMMSDIAEIRMFIEAVMWDEATKEAGLWQGEMPRRTLEAADRLKAFLMQMMNCPTESITDDFLNAVDRELNVPEGGISWDWYGEKEIAAAVLRAAVKRGLP